MVSLPQQIAYSMENTYLEPFHWTLKNELHIHIAYTNIHKIIIISLI